MVGWGVSRTQAQHHLHPCMVSIKQSLFHPPILSCPFSSVLSSSSSSSSSSYSSRLILICHHHPTQSPIQAGRQTGKQARKEKKRKAQSATHRPQTKDIVIQVIQAKPSPSQSPSQAKSKPDFLAQVPKCRVSSRVASHRTSSQEEKRREKPSRPHNIPNSNN